MVHGPRSPRTHREVTSTYERGDSSDGERSKYTPQKLWSSRSWVSCVKDW